MKYIQYFLAYLSLFSMIGLFIFDFYAIFKNNFGLTLIERDIIFSAVVPLWYIYDNFKPFKLTGDLDLYLKDKLNSYLNSQKTCLNCSSVVKANEIKNGICKYCRDLNNKSLNSGYQRKAE